jgi:hypothetical protein
MSKIQTRALLESQHLHLASLDSLEALRAWRDLLVEGRRQIQCQGGCPLGSLAGELFEAHPECREDLVDGFDQWEGAIQAGLQTMHKRGDLRRSADPDRLATALLAAIQGGLVLSDPPCRRPTRGGTGHHSRTHRLAHNQASYRAPPIGITFAERLTVGLLGSNHLIQMAPGVASLAQPSYDRIVELTATSV